MTTKKTCSNIINEINGAITRFEVYKEEDYWYSVVYYSFNSPVIYNYNDDLREIIINANEELNRLYKNTGLVDWKVDEIKRCKYPKVYDSSNV